MKGTEVTNYDYYTYISEGDDHHEGFSLLFKRNSMKIYAHEYKLRCLHKTIAHKCHK